MSGTIQSAPWGIDDNTAYAEFNGERETAPIIQTRNEWMPVAIRRTNEQAHHALEQRIGSKIEYYRYDRSHPNHG